MSFKMHWLRAGLVLREAATEGAPAPAKQPEAEPGEKPAGFFNPETGGEEKPGGAPAPTEKAGAEGERPEWLLPKYKTPEEQAKAYNDMYGQFSKKTEDLRAEIKAEAISEYGKTIGVPDDPAAYEYPEGWTAPVEQVDTALREWAKENNVSPEAFQSLINDVWAGTKSDIEQERKALGETADERISAVNNWVTKNVDASHFGVIEEVMTTAAGVAFLEGVIKAGSASGFAPDGEGAPDGGKLTRESIREAQADPRFGVDEDYTANVRSMWAKFAATQK